MVQELLDHICGIIVKVNEAILQYVLFYPFIEGANAAKKRGAKVRAQGRKVEG
jgi:hypothetical protein